MRSSEVSGFANHAASFFHSQYSLWTQVACRFDPTIGTKLFQMTLIVDFLHSALCVVKRGVLFCSYIPKEKKLCIADD